MISHVKTVCLYVSDQDRALTFYRDALGFELVRDVPMGDGTRWLEVTPPGAQTHLVLYTPPGQEDRIGTFSPVAFTASDIRATCEELVARGVDFVEPPAVRPWGGTMAIFQDPDGNTIVLHD